MPWKRRRLLLDCKLILVLPSKLLPKEWERAGKWWPIVCVYLVCQAICKKVYDQEKSAVLMREPCWLLKIPISKKKCFVGFWRVVWGLRIWKRRLRLQVIIEAESKKKIALLNWRKN